MTIWTCKECSQQWPAYTLLQAYKQREQAELKHPGKECWQVTEVKGYSLANRT